MDRRPIRAWTLGALIYGLAAVAAIVLLYFGTTTEDGRFEILKVGAQFLLVTAGGAILVAWLAVRREEDQRELARQAAVRELAEQVNAGYRRFKIVKRRLRAMIVDENGATRSERQPPYVFEAEAFERAMDELLEAQIAFELIRDTIRARDDLLPRHALKRIHDALNYAARYFHDVYQDFENGRVVRVNGAYQATEECEGIADFVGRRAWRPAPDTPWEEQIEALFRKLRNEGLGLILRYEALAGIIELRERDKKQRRESAEYRDRVRPVRRYRIVATEAIGLAFLDIQQALPRTATDSAPADAA